VEDLGCVVKGKEEWEGVSRVAKLCCDSVVLVLVGSTGNAGYVLRCKVDKY